MTKQFLAGLVGYVYQELGCDSGSGDPESAVSNRSRTASLLDHLVGGREQVVRHGGYVDRIFKGEKLRVGHHLWSPQASPLVTPVPK